MPQPLPNDKIQNSTVVASVVIDDHGPVDLWLVLLLNPEAPYFTVGEISSRGDFTEYGTYRNIVPAVRKYEDSGGDY